MRNLLITCKILLLMPFFVHASGANQSASKDAQLDHNGLPTCQDYLGEMFDSDFATGDLKEITRDGQRRLKVAIENLRDNTQKVNHLFMNMGGLAKVSLLTDLTKQNMFFSGGPGGAKTGLIEFMHPSELWKIQLSETTGPAQVFGGETKAGHEHGTNRINMKGKIMSKKFSLLDEATNATPTLLGGGLMSFLNPGERSITDENGDIIKSPIVRSSYATGNATRYQLLENFKYMGMASGPALLNRYLFKARVRNWANTMARERMDQITARIDDLKNMAFAGSEKNRAKALEELKGLVPNVLDYDILEAIANVMFKGTPAYYSAINGLEQRLHDKYNEMQRESAKIALNNQGTAGQSVPNIPPAEWTLRFRKLIDRVIRMSAAIDYFLHADIDEILNRKEPIRLGPMSVWRMQAMATTNLSGEAAEFDPETMQVIFNIETVDKFGGVKQLELADAQKDANTESEMAEIAFDYEIQQAFNEQLSIVLETQKAKAAKIATYVGNGNTPNSLTSKLAGEDFELYLFSLRYKDELTFGQKRVK